MVVDSKQVRGKNAFANFEYYENGPVNGFHARVILPDNPRALELWHEVGHALQFLRLGGVTGYLGQTRSQREKFVYLFMRGVDPDGTGYIWNQLKSRQRSSAKSVYQGWGGDIKTVRDPDNLWNSDGWDPTHTNDGGSDDWIWNAGTELWE